MQRRSRSLNHRVHCAATIGSQLRLEDLQRDLAFVLEVIGQADRRHPALAKLALNGVSALRGCVQTGDGVGYGSRSATMAKLEDLLTTGLDLVICGTAASSVSAQRGQYYAGPGNRFWTILWETGLTDRLLEPSEYGSLLDYRIGLTDVVKDQEGMDSAIDFGGCGALLRRRLEPYSPSYLCFNGKRAALEALDGKRIRYGLQAMSFGPTRLFVAPSTSAAARRWWDAGVWKKLSDLVGEARGTRPPN